MADVDNTLAPGLFKGSPAAVEAFAKSVNADGGLAGRKLVVDFIDSHLNADEARNVVIKACSEDFGVVGTASLFLNNVDDMTACVDQAGAATGIPDLPIVTTEARSNAPPCRIRSTRRSWSARPRTTRPRRSAPTAAP